MTILVTSMNGYNIDEDSKAKIGKDKLTNKRVINFLNHRPHVTSPFLARGESKPALESKIIQGMTTDDLYANKFIENKDLSEYRFTPLVPSLSKTIQNPKNLIIEEANDKFVRGYCQSSIIRDKNYLKKYGYNLRKKRK